MNLSLILIFLVNVLFLLIFFVFPYTNGVDEYFTEPKREVRNSKLKKFIA